MSGTEKRRGFYVELGVWKKGRDPPQEADFYSGHITKSQYNKIKKIAKSKLKKVM